MKRLCVVASLAAVFVIGAGSSASYAQVTVNIPFKFEAGGKAFSAGEYWIAQKGDQAISIRLGPKGAEFLVPIIKKLLPGQSQGDEPRCVFDMVGNFEPSYSEYITDYLLSEVWLPGSGGFVVLTTSGAHDHRTVKGEKIHE